MSDADDMTAMTREPITQDAQVLLEGFLALDTPEGFRAELIEGEIVVTRRRTGTTRTTSTRSSSRSSGDRRRTWTSPATRG
jgi:hypothetical protein